MYLLTTEKLKHRIPVGVLNNFYNIYAVYRDSEKIYNEKLFNTAEDAINFLLNLTERKYNNVN